MPETGRKIKNPCRIAWGEIIFTSGIWAVQNRQAIYPTEYANHKGSFHYVQRVRIPHRGQSPSSVSQLPIMTALHARSPTLFKLIIHEIKRKVNPYLNKFPKEKKSFCREVPNSGRVCWFFVYYDEKTLISKGNALAFCALFLYNNANLILGGYARGRNHRHRVRQRRHG